MPLENNYFKNSDNIRRRVSNNSYNVTKHYFFNQSKKMKISDNKLDCVKTTDSVLNFYY